MSFLLMSLVTLTFRFISGMSFTFINVCNVLVIFYFEILNSKAQMKHGLLVNSLTDMIHNTYIRETSLTKMSDHDLISRLSIRMLKLALVVF